MRANYTHKSFRPWPNGSTPHPITPCPLCPDCCGEPPTTKLLGHSSSPIWLSLVAMESSNSNTRQASVHYAKLAAAPGRCSELGRPHRHRLPPRLERRQKTLRRLARVGSPLPSRAYLWSCFPSPI